MRSLGKMAQFYLEVNGAKYPQFAIDNLLKARKFIDESISVFSDIKTRSKDLLKLNLENLRLKQLTYLNDNDKDMQVLTQEVVALEREINGIENEVKVFLSYNSKDQVQKDKVAEVFRNKGIFVIDYQEEMGPGETIKGFIRRSISIEQNHYTVNLISRNSLLSAWVAEEALLSLNLQEIRSEGYVPCLLDNILFDASFANEAHTDIKAKLADRREAMILRLQDQRSIADLYEELQLLTQLQNNLESLIGKLKGIGCRDLTQAGEIEKLADDLIKRSK